MTVRFSEKLGSGLVRVLDRLSRPVNLRSNRMQRLQMLKGVANLASISLFAVAMFGLILVFLLLFLPPSVWIKLDSACRDAYWFPFNSKVERFERALKEKDELRIKELSRSFFNLAGDLQQRDFGEKSYVRVLELALSSTTPEVRLRAAATAVDLRPNDSLFWYHLGIERMRTGQGEGGIEALQAAFKLRPFSFQVASALIHAFEQSGDEKAILRTREEYTTAVSMVVGKRAALTVMYVRPNGEMIGELVRFDSCVLSRLTLRNDPTLQFRGIIFPPVDRLYLSLDAAAVADIEQLQRFKVNSDGGFVTEIAEDDPLTMSPGIFFKGNRPESVQLRFCMTVEKTA